MVCTHAISLVPFEVEEGVTKHYSKFVVIYVFQMTQKTKQKPEIYSVSFQIDTL